VPRSIALFDRTVILPVNFSDGKTANKIMEHKSNTKPCSRVRAEALTSMKSWYQNRRPPK